MVILSSILVVGACVSPRPVGKAPLWPDGAIPDYQPRQVAAWTADMRNPSFNREEHAMPYVSWYAPPEESCRTDACMLLISGGGYSCVSDSQWIDVAARLLRARGVHCAALVYRTPRPDGLPIYKTAWEDGQRAVRLLRSEAKARGYAPEKIGAFGYSAGAHLTMLLAASSQTRAYEPVDALDEVPCHLNWAVPMYVPYALSDGSTCQNARGGDSPDAVLDEVFRFDERTCPTCLMHGGVDAFSPVASVRIYERLKNAGVPSELHLFADVGHGFMGEEGRGDGATGPDNWFDRIAEFLQQMEFTRPCAPEEERRVFTGDHTAKTECEEIWPAGRIPEPQPGHVKAPTLTWYIPKNLRTRAVQVVFPGGGYSYCNVKGEGAPVAEMFNERGMTAVVVEYRTPRPKTLAKHVSAWQDAQRAIRLVRRGAAARGLDPNRIGAMGFSAGGHLTLMCATSSRSAAYLRVDEVDDVSCAVQWAVPVYPAYVLTKEGAFEPEFAFDLDTPPMCFVHGDKDAITSMGSVKTWERLRRMGIQGDLHTLAKRGHCFQFKASPGTGSYTWFGRVWEFLNQKGFNRRDCE